MFQILRSKLSFYPLNKPIVVCTYVMPQTQLARWTKSSTWPLNVRKYHILSFLKDQYCLCVHYICTPLSYVFIIYVHLFPMCSLYMYTSFLWCVHYICTPLSYVFIIYVHLFPKCPLYMYTSNTIACQTNVALEHIISIQDFVKTLCYIKHLSTNSTFPSSTIFCVQLHFL